MNEILQNKLDLFVQNAQEIRKEYFLEWDTMKRVCALLYTLHGKTLDKEALRSCYDLIYGKVTPFSYLGGRLALVLAGQLALSENPEQLFAKTMLVYDKMKKLKFYPSDYLAYAAYLVAAQVKEEEYDWVIQRSRAYFDGVKKDHRFLTGEDDYIYMALFGLTDTSVEPTVEKTEELFQQLKPYFDVSGVTQSLSLAFSARDNSSQLVERMLQIQEGLRAAGLKLFKDDTANILEILTLVPAEVDELVGTVRECYEYLSVQKGFTGWTEEKFEILLFVSGMVATYYSSLEKDVDPIFLAKVIDRVVAKSAALVAVVVLMN